ncbi:MAG: ferredoxin family protein [Victivallales bacterium]|nr:ferredoxin family protein [Victivallales bacterium]
MASESAGNFRVEITPDECKGCLRCVNACPNKLIAPTCQVNMMGVVYVEYAGEGCIGCGACFYACPEPGAITVYEKKK